MSYPPTNKFFAAIGYPEPNTPCKIIEEGADFNAPFGCEYIDVTDKDLEALKEGKSLLSSAGEYRVLLRRKKDEDSV